MQQKLSNVEKDLEVFIQEQQAAFSEQFPNVDLSNIAEGEVDCLIQHASLNVILNLASLFWL